MVLAVWMLARLQLITQRSVTGSEVGHESTFASLGSLVLLLTALGLSVLNVMDKVIIQSCSEDFPFLQTILIGSIQDGYENEIQLRCQKKLAFSLFCFFSFDVKLS